MAWQVLTLYTLYLTVWLCPFASCQQDVGCWWNKVTSFGQSVSIECRANPPSFLQRCGGCHLRLITSEKTTHATLHRCSRNTANFSAIFTPQAMGSVKCELTCPGQTQSNCILKEAYPPPTCLIPLDVDNIHCHWSRIHNPSSPTNFTLHWEEIPETRCHTIAVGDSDSAVIERTVFQNHVFVKVWLSAVSALASVKSEEIIFTPGNIKEPLPPNIINHSDHPFEIFWGPGEEELAGRVRKCEVRHKNECDLDWTEVEDLRDTNFELDDYVPFTKYIFHVRCGYFFESEERSVMSKWSSYTAERPAAAPVGKLDVWIYCEPNSDVSNCTVLWKEMPRIQARGLINSYEVRVKLNNGSELTTVVHKPAMFCEQCGTAVDGREPATSNLNCPQEQDRYCFHYNPLRFPVWEVKDICVTAISSQGESSPALVALPSTGLQSYDVILNVTAVSRSFTVSWSWLARFSERIEEYVVQHKSIGPPFPRLNWVKVNKSENYVTLKGEFCNYTAYNVSLFAVVNNSSHLLQSAVAYTVQGAPPKVTDVRVTEISSSSVVLTWKPIPHTDSRGLILNYVVGLPDHTALNVSGDENSVRVPDLNPHQQYDVWISAVTAAGEGERTTTKFTTKATDMTVMLVVFVLLLFFAVSILFIVLFLRCRSWCERMVSSKIPDPMNSNLFQQKNSQVNVGEFRQSWLLPHSFSENTVTISHVDVVMTPESHSDLEDDHELIVELPEEEQQTEEEDAAKERRESGRLERIDSTTRRATEEYSQVVDSSEEEVSRDEDEEWEEQVSPSDYEKHFIPSFEDL